MLIDDLMMTKIQNNFLTNKDRQVYVIGDVHGCADEYEQLLNKIVNKTHNAHIIQLGDLIDRGPHLLKVFELNRDYHVQTIMGNHEYNFWLEVCSGKECRSNARKETHKKFNRLKSGKKDFIIESISNMKNWIRVLNTDSFTEYTLSHAPLSNSKFYRNGHVTNFCLTSENDRLDFKYNVHGHTHWTYKDIDIQISEYNKMCYNFNLDSGAVYGGKLTALNLFDLSFFQVQCKQYFKE